MKELEVFWDDNISWLGDGVDNILTELYNHVYELCDYEKVTEVNLAHILIDYPNNLNGY